MVGWNFTFSFWIFCHLSIICSCGKRYQALPSFTYRKQWKAGQGPGNEAIPESFLVNMPRSFLIWWCTTSILSIWLLILLPICYLDKYHANQGIHLTNEVISVNHLAGCQLWNLIISCNMHRYTILGMVESYLSLISSFIFLQWYSRVLCLQWMYAV